MEERLCSLHHDSVYDHLSNRIQRASPELLSVFFSLPFQFVEGHVSQDFKWHLKRFYGCWLSDEFYSAGDVIDQHRGKMWTLFFVELRINWKN